MMFDFECYILQKYTDDEYNNINVFGNLIYIYKRDSKNNVSLSTISI